MSSSPGGSPLSPFHPWIMASAIVLLTVVVYEPLRTAEYVQDDHLAVEDSAIVASGDPGEIFRSSYWEGAAGDDRSLYRPLTILSYAIERKCTGQPDPVVSHAVNVVLHAAVSVALLALALSFGLSRAAAGAAAVVFAAHPGHSEAVANVVGRAEVLAALFVLLALLAYLRTDRGGLRARLASWATAVAVFAGLASKEITVAVLPLLVVVDLLLRPPEHGRTTAWLVDRAGALAPTALATVVFLVLRTRALETFLSFQRIPSVDNPLVDLHGVEYLATALAVAARYARILVFPVPLSIDYSGPSIAVEPSLLAPRPVAGLLFLAGLVLLFLRPMRRSASAAPVARAASFGAALYLFPYLVIGNLLFPVGAAMAERLSYLPSAGFCWILGIFVGILAAHPPTIPGLPDGRRGVALALAFALLLLGFSALTWLRSREWQSDRTVFEAAIRTNPLSPRAHMAVGSMLAREVEDANRDRALIDTAIERFDSALVLWPESFISLNEKGGLLGRRGDLDEAVRTLREAVRMDPTFAKAHYNLGTALHRQGRLDEAERSLRKATLFDPSHDKAWAALGHVLVQEGRYAEAVFAYRRAIGLGRSDLLPRLRAASREAERPPDP